MTGMQSTERRAEQEVDPGLLAVCVEGFLTAEDCLLPCRTLNDTSQ